MWKIRFLVKATSWSYENTQYFETCKEAETWANVRGVEIISIEKVPEEEFANDYIASL